MFALLFNKHCTLLDTYFCFFLIRIRTYGVFFFVTEIRYSCKIHRTPMIILEVRAGKSGDKGEPVAPRHSIVVGTEGGANKMVGRWEDERRCRSGNNGNDGAKSAWGGNFIKNTGGVTCVRPGRGCVLLFHAIKQRRRCLPFSRVCSIPLAYIYFFTYIRIYILYPLHDIIFRPLSSHNIL